MSNISRSVVIAAAIVGPPVLTYGLSLLIPEHGLDTFSVLIIEMLAFALSVTILRPRPWRAVLAALLYFPSMFIVIFWIGYRVGYYDLP